jgi:hypothetical protein
VGVAHTAFAHRVNPPSPLTLSHCLSVKTGQVLRDISFVWSIFRGGGAAYPVCMSCRCVALKQRYGETHACVTCGLMLLSVSLCSGFHHFLGGVYGDPHRSRNCHGQEHQSWAYNLNTSPVNSCSGARLLRPGPWRIREAHPVGARLSTHQCNWSTNSPQRSPSPSPLHSTAPRADNRNCNSGSDTTSHSRIRVTGGTIPCQR